MLTRYLAQVDSVQIGSGQPITYTQGDDVVNLDTGTRMTATQDARSCNTSKLL